MLEALNENPALLVVATAAINWAISIAVNKRDIFYLWEAIKELKDSRKSMWRAINQRKFGDP